MSLTDTNSDSVLIFIGPGRSGSTVISEFIMVHEQLAWPAHFLEYAPKLPELDILRRAFDNRLWRLHGEKAQLNSTRFLNTLIPRPTEAYQFWDNITRPEIDFSRGFLLGEVATEDEKKRIQKAVKNMKARQNRRHFAMKITGPGRIGYLKSIFPNAHFINIVRDPVATVNSLLKVPFWKDLGMHRLWWNGAYSNQEVIQYNELKSDPALGTAFQLRKLMTTTLEEAQTQDAKILNIHFEDFVRDPTTTCEQILTFAGLPHSYAIADKLSSTTIHDRPSTDQLSQSQVEEIKKMFPESFPADTTPENCFASKTHPTPPGQREVLL